MCINGRKRRRQINIIKMSFGIYQKDSGSIVFQGKELDFPFGEEALENGISISTPGVKHGITISVHG